MFTKDDGSIHTVYGRSYGGWNVLTRIQATMSLVSEAREKGKEDEKTGLIPKGRIGGATR